MAHVTITSYNHNSCSAEIVNLQYDSSLYDDFEMICNGSTIHSSSATFSGLSPSTSYTVVGKAQWNGTWHTVPSASFTTKSDPNAVPPSTPANLGCRDFFGSTTRIVIGWDSSVNADNYTILYKKSTSTTWKTIIASSPIQSFKELEPYTQLNFKVRANNSYGSSSYTSVITCSTLDPVKPSSFSWDSAKVAGDDFNLTAIEWSKLTNKIKAFRDYKCLESYTFIYGYPESNDVFTAAAFNEAINAIASMNPSESLPSNKSPGDPVRALDLNKLVSSLNSIS